MCDTISMRMIEDHKKESETNQGCDLRKEAIMANSNFNLSIPSGTIVFMDVRGSAITFTLQADVHVSDAIRQADGGFIYQVGGHDYYVSAGNCAFAQ